MVKHRLDDLAMTAMRGEQMPEEWPGEWKETGRGVVHPWLCDQFGHMNVRYYNNYFDDASFHVWTANALGVVEMEARGVVTVVATTKYDFMEEMTVGQTLVIKSGFIRVGTKSITYLQKMFDADHGTLHASNEGTEVFFDPETRRSTGMPDWFRERLTAILVDPEGP